MTIPHDRKFTTTHEWVKVDGEIATIGLTDFAQSELGDITYLELPGVGAKVSKAESLGVVESVKAASDIYSPVSGDVVEENDAAVSTPEVINSSPWDDAWLVKVHLDDPAQLNDLLDPVAYEKVLAESGSH
jgi:glycine cleavage system H protein